jgi:hypothetical protein
MFDPPQTPRNPRWTKFSSSVSSIWGLLDCQVGAKVHCWLLPRSEIHMNFH